MRPHTAVPGIAVALAAAATPLAAQGLGCGAGASAYCGRAAQAAEIVLVRTAIAGALGNPVPGTASTLGMRIGAVPRISIAARYGAVRTGLPRLRDAGDTGDHDVNFTSLGVDAGVGLFSGIALGPTVGGFASIDLLASLASIGTPDADGWDGSSFHSWGLGARFGILRESFTAPGLSLSVMRRGAGELEYGRSDFASQDAFLHIEDLASWSLRAAVGKRVAGIGLTGGIGWDRASGDVLVRARDGTVDEVERDGFDASRFTAWADASFTLLVFNAVLDVGWQGGGDAPGAGPDYVSDGAFYGAIALRIAI